MKVNLSDRIRPNIEAAPWVVDEVKRMDDRIKRLEEGIEIAWGIIANVDSGSWEDQQADWREAAIRWRDEQFYPAFKAKEAKP